MIPTLKDSRGRESTTLTLVLISWVVTVFKFAFAGLTIYQLTFPPMSASEFGMATAGILAIWLGREWTEKTQRLQK